MPPKGFKKPEQTRCATCGQLLPRFALQVVIKRARELRALLDEPPRWEGEDKLLWDRTLVFHTKAWLDRLFVENGDGAGFCLGHGAKPGPRKKEPATADPSFPADPETPKPKRRRLRAVQSGGDE